MISITGLNKAVVLAALYNAARPQGMGFMQYAPEPMSSREAEELLAKHTYFDYLKGRVMKLSLKEDGEIEERLYDRDNGPGTAARVIAELRAGNGENSPAIREQHATAKVEAAARVKTNLDKPSTWDPDTKTFTLGLTDVADKLGPAVDKALD